MSHQSAPETNSHVSLGAFEEICGRLKTIRQDDSTIYLELSSGTLRFASGTPEADQCKRELGGEEGAYVSILRVPLGTPTLRIRIEDGAD